MLCTDWSGGGHTLRRRFFWEKTRLHRPVDVTGYDEPATTASGAWVTGDTTNDKWLGYLFLWTCLSAGYPAIRWPMPRADSGNVPVVSIPPTRLRTSLTINAALHYHRQQFASHPSLAPSWSLFPQPHRHVDNSRQSGGDLNASRQSVIACHQLSFHQDVRGNP
jgi:hypothetical protein